MPIAVIIPCRYQSTRFKGKPLLPLAGKPMVQHVYERVGRAAAVDCVAVATDDERIRRAVEGFGGRAVMTDGRHRSGTDRVAEAARHLGLADDAIVINVQGDQPAVSPLSIAAVVQPLVEEADLPMSTLAYAISDASEIFHPKDVKVVCNDAGDALFFSRAPIPFARDADWRTVSDRTGFSLHFDVAADAAAGFAALKHLGVYAYRRWFLETFSGLPSGRLEQIEKLEQLRALEHGYRIRVVPTDHDSPEIDCPEDLARLERHWAAGGD